MCSLQVFNPFSAQLILSLCRLKEFLAMSHSERVRAVGQFVDGETLVRSILGMGNFFLWLMFA